MRACLTPTLTLEHPVRSRHLLTAPVTRIMPLPRRWGPATAIITGRRLRLFVETRKSTRIPTGRTTKLKSNAEESERKLSLLSSRGLPSDRNLALVPVPVPAPALVPGPVPAPVPALVRYHLCRMPMFQFIMPRLMCTTPHARRTTDMDLLTHEECRRMYVSTADRFEVVDACNNKSSSKTGKGVPPARKGKSCYSKEVRHLFSEALVVVDLRIILA